MKIERLSIDEEERENTQARLRRVFEAEEQVARPCGAACQRICPKCGSIDCGCSCSRDCPEIPYVLTSDPENYPLEPGATGLVFEMKRLGIYEPCWSCEGHESVDGKLWKIPRVWFYCRSLVYVRLLYDGIKELYLRKITKVPWQVVLTYSDADNPDTMFSLEPVIKNDNAVVLADVQKDAVAIAERLHAMITGRARVLAAKT